MIIVTIDNIIKLRYKYFFSGQICIFDELDAGSDPNPAWLPDAQPRQLHCQAGPAAVIPVHCQKSFSTQNFAFAIAMKRF